MRYQLWTVLLTPSDSGLASPWNYRRGQSWSITLVGCNLSRKMERIRSLLHGWGGDLPSHLPRLCPEEELVLVPTFPSPLLPLESSSAPPSRLCLLINLLLSNKAIDIHCETRLSRPAHTTNLIPFSACQRGWYCSVSHMIVCWSFSRKWSHHQYAFTNLSHLALAGCQGGCSLETLSSSLLKCFVLH